MIENKQMDGCWMFKKIIYVHEYRAMYHVSQVQCVNLGFNRFLSCLSIYRVCRYAPVLGTAGHFKGRSSFIAFGVYKSVCLSEYFSQMQEKNKKEGQENINITE